MIAILRPLNKIVIVVEEDKQRVGGTEEGARNRGRVRQIVQKGKTKATKN